MISAVPDSRTHRAGATTPTATTPQAVFKLMFLLGLVAVLVGCDGRSSGPARVSGTVPDPRSAEEIRRDEIALAAAQEALAAEQAAAAAAEEEARLAREAATLPAEMFYIRVPGRDRDRGWFARFETPDGPCIVVYHSSHYVPDAEPNLWCWPTEAAGPAVEPAPDIDDNAATTGPATTEPEETNG